MIEKINRNNKKIQNKISTNNKTSPTHTNQKFNGKHDNKHKGSLNRAQTSSASKSKKSELALTIQNDVLLTNRKASYEFKNLSNTKSNANTTNNNEDANPNANAKSKEKDKEMEKLSEKDSKELPIERELDKAQDKSNAQPMEKEFEKNSVKDKMKPIGKEVEKNCVKEKLKPMEKEPERKPEKVQEKPTEKEQEKEKIKEKGKEKERERDTQKEKEKDKDRDPEKEKDKIRIKEKDKSKEKEKEKTKEKEKIKEREKIKEKETEKIKEKERDKEKQLEMQKEQERQQKKDEEEQKIKEMEREMNTAKYKETKGEKGNRRDKEKNKENEHESESESENENVAEKEQEKQQEKENVSLLERVRVKETLKSRLEREHLRVKALSARSSTSRRLHLPPDSPILKLKNVKVPITEPQDIEEYDTELDDVIPVIEIPEVLRKQGSASYCSSSAENICPCNTMLGVEQVSKQITYCNRKAWISVERMQELRKKAQDALKNHRTFTIRGCFFSVRNALASRGWVEKLDVHRKSMPSGVCQITYEDLTHALPKRKAGETRRQYLIKCERNVMSRFLEHMPIHFLWTARKEKCDYIDQAKNPTMIINKFHRVPFTSKEGLCNQLKDFHWFYEEGTSELYFPRCYNVWSPEELTDFIDNFRTTACIGFLRLVVDSYQKQGIDACFTTTGKVPFTAIEFAIKRCHEFIDNCCHNDIDGFMETTRIWDHDWDAFLTHHFLFTQDKQKIFPESTRGSIESIIKLAENVLNLIIDHWPQYNLDGYLNLWIVKPANKCRGRGIHLTDNLKKILNIVNPAITSKSRYVVQKYIERPLIIHNTKFDVRQWFLITSAQPMVIWMYKECYLRFSSQEYNLRNHHESVHLTNYAIQKKYRNGKRDKRLPIENMWDSYSFQAHLRQIGQQKMWTDRIYPGMRRAIIGSMLASQENMDRRSNTFELFGADFMISEDFYPWLIEINSSPDLGATTSVTARMCPQCLEDVIKVVIDKRVDPKADTGAFEMIYRQSVPPTPAYMGLNLFLRGKQLLAKGSQQSITSRLKDRATSSVGTRQSMPSVSYHTATPIIDLQHFRECDPNGSTLSLGDKPLHLMTFDPTNKSNFKFQNQDHLPSSSYLFQIPANKLVLRKSCLANLAGSNHFLRPTPPPDTTILNYTEHLSPYPTTLLIPSQIIPTPNKTASQHQLHLSTTSSVGGCNSSSSIIGQGNGVERERRRSNEITTNWRQLNETINKNYNINENRKSLITGSSSSSKGSTMQRNFSCGPRISAINISTGIDETNLNESNLLKTFNTTTNQEIGAISLVTDDIIETNLIESSETPICAVDVKTIPTTCRKKLYDLLYKSKSAGRVSRSNKTSLIIMNKSKSTPITNANLNSTISNSAALLSYRRNCLLNRKNSNNNDGNSCRRLMHENISNGVGGFNTNTKDRLSLRAWRSKQLGIVNMKNIGGSSTSSSSLIKMNGTCKSAPLKQKLQQNE